MSNKTAQTLTLVAAILFILQFIIGIVAGIGIYFFFPQLLAIVVSQPGMDPATLALITNLFTQFQLIIPISIAVTSIITLVFGIFTLQWRHEPWLHKTGLLVIGIIGLVFAGSIPGILALIAGIIVEEK